MADHSTLHHETGNTPPVTVADLSRWLQAGETNSIQQAFSALHPADAAELVQQIDSEPRAALLETLHPETLSAVLSYLDESSRDDVVEELEVSTLAAAVAELDTDDAVALVQDLDDDDKQELLAAIPSSDRIILEESLNYPEYSAGRLMQRDLVAVPGHWNVGQVIDYMRSSRTLPDDFYEIFVIDPKHKLLGSVPLSRLMRTRRPVEIAEIMATDRKTLSVTSDQEEVAFRFRKYGLVSAPVIDEHGRLLGMITVDDVVSVIDAEAADDILRLGGVSEDTDYTRPVREAIKPRFVWLLVNLVTAIMAAWVISLFEHTIQTVVILAALAPIVASMGGNAGTQTLTVVIRAIAMRQMPKGAARRVLIKEALIGLGNGIMFAVITGLFVALWIKSAAIGIVMALAMLVNIMAANVVGALIPIGMRSLKIDPAIASGVFITTVTDLVGFFVFLGLASLLLM
jgi:magnesium transporter